MRDLRNISHNKGTIIDNSGPPILGCMPTHLTILKPVYDMFGINVLKSSL